MLMQNVRHVDGFQISRPIVSFRRPLLSFQDPSLGYLDQLSSNNHQLGTARRRRSSRRDQHRTESATRLYSLQHLVDEVSSGKKNRGPPQTIFVGGKGGVGKTTVSSALAVSLASLLEQDLKVLIVSTDPAHSLGDALDEDLQKLQQGTHGKPIQMTDPLTAGRLYACEVDAGLALEEFRDNLASFDVGRLANALGVSQDLLESLGLADFSSLLNNPPPGLDELVALANVLDTESNDGDFDVVIVDTAPTGHTLRLLALPQFLDGLLGKLIKLRMKLSGVVNNLQAFFGNQQSQQQAKAIDDAANRLTAFQTKMARLRSNLQNKDRTRFVIVTVPTKLGVAESKRLAAELNSQSVSVTDIVVNQCILDYASSSSSSSSTPDPSTSSPAALQAYYERRKAGQVKWIHNLEEAVDRVSQSEEYQNNGRDSKPIAMTTVPYFDVELVGIPALAYVGSQCYMNNPNFEHLMQHDNNSAAPKVVIAGGKGGVGKTTTSAALAVSMAAQGHKVALISTDPAHSLGDAVDMNLKGGQLLDCPLIGLPPGAAREGSLSVLEVDPTSAIQDFKGLVDQLVGTDGAVADENSNLRKTLREVQEVFDTLPAGTDEVVALAKIVNLVKKGGFSRIVLDTAPTGHTLRMLSTPGFLAELIERLLGIANKVNSNAAIQMLLSSSAKSEEIQAGTDAAKSKMLSFQLQMYDLEELFSNADQTEFIIVTIPTELAVRESMRLLNDLTFEVPDMPIKVRNIVVNQVLKNDDSNNEAEIFLSHVAQTQKSSVTELQQAAQTLVNPPAVVTLVRYLDTEPRNVFGLKILAEELLREEGSVAAVNE